VTGNTGPQAPQSPPAPGQEPAVASPRPAVHSRPSMAGMSSDPRVGIWIRRAIMALIAGLAIGIWLNWRLGLTAAAVVAILDTLYQSRAMSPIPAHALAAGAQRRTRRQLSGLRRSGYVTLNARSIPGSDQVIDHLVIGPSGVFAIDSERWDKRLPVRATGGGPKSSGVLYHGPYSQADRLAHARWEASQASHLIGTRLQHPVTVRPTMVIYGPDISWDVATLRGVDVLGGKSIRKFIKKQARGARAARMTDEEIHALAEAAQEVLPPVGG
jgi:Nuclease-related domain